MTSRVILPALSRLSYRPVPCSRPGAIRTALGFEGRDLSRVLPEPGGRAGDSRKLGRRNSIDDERTTRQDPFRRRPTQPQVLLHHLVTTSPQSPTIPWAPTSLTGRTATSSTAGFRDVTTAVCTGPGNVFTADATAISDWTLCSRVADCNPNLQFGFLGLVHLAALQPFVLTIRTRASRAQRLMRT